MKKILLIEDNIQILENTSEILALAGYAVITADNGKTGVELAQQESPDLIICDITMPVMDGYGVLHLLSKNPQTEQIPFIFLTAKSERDDFRKGMELGADDYLTKPFDDMELLRAIESRIRKSETFRKEFSWDIKGFDDFMSDVRGIEELKKLSENREIRSNKKKEYIFREDHHPHGLFFIQKGKVKTYKTHELGKELITGLYGAGDFFGYLPLMENTKYTDTAETLEDSEICFIPKEDFFALLLRNTHVSRKFIHMLSNRLAEKEEQLINLAYNSVRKRVADALVNLSNRFNTEDKGTFSMRVSREDLANLAGTATETTIRTLSDFRDEGLIDIKGGTISILAPTKLSALKN